MARKTHLYNYHVENAKMTLFAGFEMPLWYEGIIPEHMAVRESVGIFDVTHMGRALVSGPDVPEYLDYILSRRVSDLDIYRGRYCLMLNEKGGIVDDLTVFRLSKKEYLVVYNASNREKDYLWMVRNSTDYDVLIKEISDETPMYAVQGPKAKFVLSKIFGDEIFNIKRYWGKWFSLDDKRIFITRSGYTGEDGFELYLWNTPLNDYVSAYKLWSTILEEGSEYGIKPCGLGARDTLRLEAGMCLYDHDINEDINPFEARLDFTVSMDKERFIGKDALEKILKEGVKRFRVGIRLREKGIPREGYKVLSEDGKIIGRVTSGTYSPLLKNGIAMAYLPVEYTSSGTKVYIEIRGKPVEGTVVDMPFYDTKRYGWRRVE